MTVATGPGSEHWLQRLTCEQWLAAAETELKLATQHEHARRKALTHVRRACGMGLNAILVAHFDERAAETVWGRSYVEHLRSIAEGSPLPSVLEAHEVSLRSTCRLVLETPLVHGSGTRTSELVALGRSAPAPQPQTSIAAARDLLDFCHGACAAPPV